MAKKGVVVNEVVGGWPRLVLADARRVVHLPDLLFAHQPLLQQEPVLPQVEMPSSW